MPHRNLKITILYRYTYAENKLSRNFFASHISVDSFLFCRYGSR
ncbi:hypothetical protein NNO_1576 [Hydrogenimonas sp.]|nr:hypothetical protein NNO_1576 [Hydrogenimonas sp.]